MAGSLRDTDRARERFEANRIQYGLRVVRFVFSVDDLARTRFAISPIWEAIRSLVALRDPSTAALHLPWLRSLSGRLDADLEPVIALIPTRGYIPDFLTPPPSGPLGDIGEDLDALRRTPVRQIRHDIELYREQHPRVRVSDDWLEHPRREARRLADTVESFWEQALEPVWPRIRAFLDADIAHRAAQLVEAGPAHLFGDLHPTVAWADGRVEIANEREATIALGGRGLVLMPSAFQWARPGMRDREPLQPTLNYPARGINTLWEEGEPAPEGLSRLLGATRAAVLQALDAPRSTTDLAQRLSISPAGASHHLTTLRDAGLIVARRERREVLYVRTATGDTLVSRPR